MNLVVAMVGVCRGVGGMREGGGLRGVRRWWGGGVSRKERRRGPGERRVGLGKELNERGMIGVDQRFYLSSLSRQRQPLSRVSRHECLTIHRMFDTPCS